MSDLFRPEVVERQVNRLHGEILILPRFPHVFILTLLLIWVLAAGYWLVSSTYARKETVFGWLEPPQGVTRVYAEDSGIVQGVLVEEGDVVQPGQSLIVVSGDRYLADGERLEHRLLGEYEAQQRLLREQLDRTTSIHERRGVDIDQRIAAATTDLELLGTRYGGSDGEYAYCRFEQKIEKIAGPEFTNTLADNLAVIKQDDGIWKLWSCLPLMMRPA
jgi:membrane fusion protein